MSANFTFEIASPKHGRFTVIAPSRFRSEIERISWSVKKCRNRAPGREFVVMAHAPQVNGIPGKAIYLHVLIWQLAGREPTPQIDHRDGQPLNNAEDNLRAATPSQNTANSRIRRSNTSGRIGVDSFNGKWRARILVNREEHYLGMFATIEEAAAARDRAALELHGEFAVLNSKDLERGSTAPRQESRDEPCRAPKYGESLPNACRESGPVTSITGMENGGKGLAGPDHNALGEPVPEATPSAMPSGVVTAERVPQLFEGGGR